MQTYDVIVVYTNSRGVLFILYFLIINNKQALLNNTFTHNKASKP